MSKTNIGRDKRIGEEKTSAARTDHQFDGSALSWEINPYRMYSYVETC